MGESVHEHHRCLYLPTSRVGDLTTCGPIFHRSITRRTRGGDPRVGTTGSSSHMPRKWSDTDSSTLRDPKGEAFNNLVDAIRVHCRNQHITRQSDMQTIVDRYKQRLTVDVILGGVGTGSSSHVPRKWSDTDDSDSDTGSRTGSDEKEGNAGSSKRARSLSPTAAVTVAAESSSLPQGQPPSPEKGQTHHAVQEGTCGTCGAKKQHQLCSHAGCTNHAVQGGTCQAHGSKKMRRQCGHAGCTTLARNKGGRCIRHGGSKTIKAMCLDAGCSLVSVKGGVCRRHGAPKRKACSAEGCVNGAQNGGLCKRHGARVKLCGREGCTKQVERGGLCVRHRTVRDDYGVDVCE